MERKTIEENKNGARDYAALVQLGFVASIHPGPAAVSFALSVAFTMLSAQSFDPRLIWRGLPLRSYRK